MEELVFTDAPDGLELTGIVIGDPRGTLAVLSHGSGARFCQRSYVQIGRALGAHGVALLSGDTRGHDIAAIQDVGDEIVSIGAAFEQFAGSITDAATWMHYGRAAGGSPIIAVGHSMGAAKTVLAIGQGAPADALVLLSPSVSWEDNSSRIEMARAQIADGRGDQTMPRRPDAPNWNLVCANTLAQRADLIEGVFQPGASAWTAVDLPVLVVFGASEDGAERDIDILIAGWKSDHKLTCRLVDDAGHDYTSREVAVAAMIADWLRESALENASG